MLSEKYTDEARENVKRRRVGKGLDSFRFEEDVDENLLLIDSKGKVRIWDPESEELEKGCGSSFATWRKSSKCLCSGHTH